MAAPLYFDADHPLLSDDALALSADALAAQGIVAEKVLGLSGTSLDADAATEAAAAVALQINYQVSLPPEAWALKRDKTGPLETEYRDAMPAAYPPALAMVEALLDEADTSSSDSSSSGWPFMGPRR